MEQFVVSFIKKINASTSGIHVIRDFLKFADLKTFSDISEYFIYEFIISFKYHFYFIFQSLIYKQAPAYYNESRDNLQPIVLKKSRKI